jgi:hypothetical protein
MTAKVLNQSPVPQPQRVENKPGLCLGGKVALVAGLFFAAVVAFVVAKVLIKTVIVVLTAAAAIGLCLYLLRGKPQPAPTPFIDHSANEMVCLETTILDAKGTPVKVLLQEEFSLTNKKGPSRYTVSQWVAFKNEFRLQRDFRIMTVENFEKWLKWASSDQTLWDGKKTKALDPLVIPIDMPRDHDDDGLRTTAISNAFRAARNFLKTNHVKTPLITITFDVYDKSNHDVPDVSTRPGFTYNLTALHQRCFS